MEPKKPKKKRGRKPNFTEEELKELQPRINFLHWTSNCSIARICRHFPGLSFPVANSLLVSREEYERTM